MCRWIDAPAESLGDEIGVAALGRQVEQFFETAAMLGVGAMLRSSSILAGQRERVCLNSVFR